ncbi:PTS glucose transporter subunit IIA [Lactiplantibacillus paraxiangfangensis]|uniref:PTS sugar transporter subunit IIA n=1 Tax=Lactiplantibacillus paraxiangfangensis TaxID=3076224 RepID=UPI0030C6DFD6
MNFFGKRIKNSDTAIVSPVNGEVVPITKVPDEVFAQKMMGDGLAVIPTDDVVVAPIDGKVSFIAETRHGIGITSKTGLEMVVHLGIDTVNLKGAPFNVQVKLNQSIKAGQPLVMMDRQAIVAAKLDPIVIIAMTNLNDLKQRIELTVGSAQAGQAVATLKPVN